MRFMSLHAGAAVVCSVMADNINKNKVSIFFMLFCLLFYFVSNGYTFASLRLLTGISMTTGRATSEG